MVGINHQHTNRPGSRNTKKQLPGRLLRSPLREHRRSCWTPSWTAPSEEPQKDFPSTEPHAEDRDGEVQPASNTSGVSSGRGQGGGRAALDGELQVVQLVAGQEEIQPPAQRRDEEERRRESDQREALLASSSSPRPRPFSTRQGRTGARRSPPSWITRPRNQSARRRRGEG